ncbi:MAG TPA: cytochrome c, partial [Kofleriaceae bacterium]|nr:cytochrome c [Kofleriaceae bacterium]
SAHVVISRRHGLTPVRRRDRLAPRWPAQSMRDVTAIAVVLSILLAFVIYQGGVTLDAPADPTRAFDARPLWYFRWLFELRELAGSAEQLVAMAVPAVVVGFLVSLPIVDGRLPRRLLMGALVGLFAAIAGLTVMSFARDHADDDLAKRLAADGARAERARALAKQYGVPASGGQDIFAMAPMWKARTLYAQRCASCHEDGSKDRKGPVIGPGYMNRAWIAAFLAAPSDDRFWGRTKLAQTDAAMRPVQVDNPAKLDELVEAVYAQTGARDVGAAKRDRGLALFEEMCTDCHSLVEGVSGSGPNLAGAGTRAHYTSFIGNPKSAVHMGADKSEMPRFDDELTVFERDAIAEYLVWLRTATASDLHALGPL